MKRPPSALAHLSGELSRLEEEGLLRSRGVPPPEGALVFCTNDYLGLASREAQGVAGAGAARLVSGDRSEHTELEAALVDWLACESALVFASGYAANTGAIEALAGAGDVIVSDALNHASIIDGARLSRARVFVVPHLDVDAVEQALASPEATGARRRWVLTESYFSMDADTPDLARLRAICDEHRAGLYVDEAHALGVLGPDGRGVCAEAGVTADVLVGTLGKAFGASGAFVAGSAALTTWLWNRARPFVFSTGMSPVVASAATAAVQIARTSPQLRERVKVNATALRAGLAALGRPALGFGHIIPWVLGNPSHAVAVAAQLRQRGIWTVAIRPPTVPRDTARIRFTATARQTSAEVDQVLVALRELGGGRFT